MKKIIYLLAALLLVVQPLFSQSKTASRDHYLQKSKRQRTAGIILFAGGTALVVAGLVIGAGNTDASDLNGGPNFDEGMWLVIPGVAAELASIPLFISAANNRRKAASVGIGIERPGSPVLARNGRPWMPVITMRIPL